MREGGGGRFGCYCKRAAPIVIEHLLALLLERTLATSLQTKRKSSISDELKRDSNIQCELKKKKINSCISGKVHSKTLTKMVSFAPKTLRCIPETDTCQYRGDALGKVIEDHENVGHSRTEVVFL